MSDAAHETLIVFTRWPEAGAAKTRLIPKLGEQGAADLQRHMTHQTMRVLDRLRAQRGASLRIVVRFTGGDAERMAGMFGQEQRYEPQGEGDLGDRLTRAVADAVNAGSARTIVIGTDCPALDAARLGEAFDALTDADVVLGPAADGGYYLIGLRGFHAALFAGVDWGTACVLEQTRAIAAEHRLGVRLLEELRDIDRPEDLHEWARLHRQSVSVVIPARNEADRIGVSIALAHRNAYAEVVVVDGGSTDATAERARAVGATVIASKPGRAIQMNAGAEVTAGDVLIFCHADTHLPQDYDRLACEALSRPGVAAGAFSLQLRGEGRGLRLIEWGVAQRCRWLGTPYGDQAIFVRRATFETLGGYRDLPIMEDYDLIRRAKKLGRIVLADGAVTSSARYWKQRGVVRGTLNNKLVIWGWRFGVNPATLARWRSGAPLRGGR